MAAIRRTCATQIKPPGEALGRQFPMAALRAAVWPEEKRRLRVYFMDGEEDIKEKVRHYARQWEEYSGITFDFIDDIDAEIRIAFDQSEEKSWSYLGTDALYYKYPEPTMNFGWLEKNTSDEEFQRVVLHEFGHALGCVHEHLRPEAAAIPWNEEALYKHYGKMGWSEQDVRDNILNRLLAENLNGTDRLDTKSIMMYRVEKENVDDPAWIIGDNHELSELDKEKIGEVYKKSGG